MTAVLEGVRVLDFGRYIAGPFCATLLSDLGADVIRIEKVDGGEDRWTTPVAKGGDGAGFMQWGRNKRGMTLNPRTRDGSEILKRLVATADVVIANLPPATLVEMGLDYASLVGDQTGHHPDHGHRVRRAGSVCRTGRIRRRSAGAVGKHVFDR